MGIGIGGGLGPFRGGISTRGAGAGCGPLSAGSGWGGCGGLVGALIVLSVAVVAVYLLVAWPWLLGAALAESLGAQDPSAARTAVGWAFEVAVIALLAALVAALYARRAANARRTATMAALLDVEASLDTLTAIANAVRVADDGPDSDTILVLPDVRLIAPRVPSRGAPPRPTSIDEGRLIFSRKALTFVGAAKSVQWDFAKMTQLVVGDDFVNLPVSNRQSVMGVGSTTGSSDALRIAIRWACGRSSPTQTITQLEPLITRARAVQAALQTQLAK